MIVMSKSKQRLTEEERDWYTLAEIAAQLGVSHQWAHNLVRTNPEQIGAYRIGVGRWRVNKAKFDAYLSQSINSNVNHPKT